MNNIHFTKAIALFVVILAGLYGQPCATPSDNYWQRDSLPSTSTSVPTAVGVVLGLCEGESGGVVFELPVGMPPQQITQVVAPWGAIGGVAGFNAILDLMVFDGVTFPGGIPNMGTQVFSLGGVGSSMQVTSHGLNVLDVSAFGITVGNSAASRKFVIAFRVDFNLHPTGSCATFWPANFFTDASGAAGTFCNSTVTPPQTSLMEISGQGWRDASTAIVQGTQLCPNYYRGIWVIRACSRDAAPANLFQVVSLSPLPITAPGTLILRFDLPGFQGYPYLAAASLGNLPGIATPYGTIPLNPDALFNFSLDPVLSAGIFLNFTGTVGGTGTGTGLINLPAGISNLTFFVGCVGIPPLGNPWAISDALMVQVN
jgi:hypothetical protein